MSSEVAPPFVAGNLALDFINTLFGTGADQHECLEEDASVVEWLCQAGVLTEAVTPPPAGLLQRSRALREEMRRLVISAKDGRAADPDLVNEVLERGHPVERLEWEPEKAAFSKKEERRDLSAESLLQPVVQALVKLLTEENLPLVKECEACDCVLLFHDQTKSHRRRWCSMASCGNRAKALAYRAKRKAK
ncbi:CGNR zinc finger domain-containing protein [Marinimicrobium agarilyticum]|uniref:CGNR zinc finger domain-containing protein n=1 Tax=Marinimicrobium agarilyticum TaxID=306546 RepID=UPI0004801EDD|nr:ABATE domain-containing protein [Marinimicrobium agarilyticum]